MAASYPSIKLDKITSNYRLSNVGPPLDFSFGNLTAVSDCLEEEPRKGTKVKEGYNEIVTAVRFNNNSISELNDLVPTIQSIVIDMNAVSWLDFSFNDVINLHKCFAEFPNLSTLYLHGNHIVSLNEVKKLIPLVKLKILTLHGNPLESLEGYREYIVGTLPSLKQLDFSAVTKQDRMNASNWDKLVGKRMVMSKKQRKTKD